VRSLVDVGCGSLAWLPAAIDARDEAVAAEAAATPAAAAAAAAVATTAADASALAAPPLRFHGVDVVPSLIEAHAARYAASRPSWSFSSGDASAAAFADSGIPTGADLLLCRDALQHLPLALAARALENMARHSGARLLLLGSYHVAGFNCDMQTPGFFSWVSLLKAPFLLPRPLAVFDEGYDAKQLLLFDGEALRREVDWAALHARAAAHTSHAAFRDALSDMACGPPPPLGEEDL